MQYHKEDLDKADYGSIATPCSMVAIHPLDAGQYILAICWGLYEEHTMKITFVE